MWALLLSGAAGGGGSERENPKAGLKESEEATGKEGV